jgi:hypothetical protein
MDLNECLREIDDSTMPDDKKKAARDTIIELAAKATTEEELNITGKELLNKSPYDQQRLRQAFKYQAQQTAKNDPGVVSADEAKKMSPGARAKAVASGKKIDFSWLNVS